MWKQNRIFLKTTFKPNFYSIKIIKHIVMEFIDTSYKGESLSETVIKNRVTKWKNRGVKENQIKNYLSDARWKKALCNEVYKIQMGYAKAC